VFIDSRRSWTRPFLGTGGHSDSVTGNRKLWVTERSTAIEIRDHRIELCQGCVVVTFLESLPCRDELVAKLATQFVIALLGVPEHRSAPDGFAIF